ncbi:MAG: peroxiredoxin [Bacteroidota bacterium]|jgi:peroxiredoxin Q/BCP|nr:peroxiredoxin [Bacteroidota bacterium]
MPLKVDQKAPDFTLPSTHKNNFTLSLDAKDTPCIIYFYPKDFTGGCTKEACEFRDSFEEFKDLNISIYGISRDNIATHMKFKKAYKLPFHLLSDEDGTVASKYGASLPLLNFTRRITYLLDENHIIRAVYTNLFDASQHIKEMVEEVNKKYQV